MGPKPTIYIYLYVCTPITPFWWAILCFKMSRNRGRYEESEGERSKKQKKTKCQDMKSTDLLGGCLLRASFAVKQGIF